jgi:L-rhamnose mutarotase
MSIRYCLALDLVDDPVLIGDYEAYHRNVWPEIKQSILNAGVLQMEIYRFTNRLFMIMEVTVEFNFMVKAEADKADQKVQEWEQLMWKYQQAIPGTKPGQKWVLMDKIFSLK